MPLIVGPILPEANSYLAQGSKAVTWYVPGTVRERYPGDYAVRLIDVLVKK